MLSRTHRILLGTLASVIVVTGAVFAFRSSDPSPGPEPLRKLRIANIGLFSNYNVIADKMGFFRENGLDATVVEYDSGASTMTALLSGEADVAVAASFVVVRNLFSTNDIRILASVSSHDVFRVLARRDSGIEKPSDLKGKRVGVTLRTAGEFHLGSFLLLNDLSREDLAIVDLSASDIITKLTEGNIDAGVIFEPNAYRVEQSLAGNIVGWSSQGNRREMAVLFTTKGFVQSDPETLDRYLRALVEAERYQNEHEADAKRLLADTLGYDEGYMERIWPRFDFGVRLDQDLLVTMENQARWNIAGGLVEGDRTPDYTEYIHFLPLDNADPSAVSIIHGP